MSRQLSFLLLLASSCLTSSPASKLPRLSYVAVLLFSFCLSNFSAYSANFSAYSANFSTNVGLTVPFNARLNAVDHYPLNPTVVNFNAVSANAVSANAVSANVVSSRSVPVLPSKQTTSEQVIRAVITSSRSDCASPCTIVFSAEKTLAKGLDEHGVWSQLGYFWDFGTAGDTGENGRQLYSPEYTYVEGDTRFEFGHVPMVTKTFLCDVGTCIYRVGMRAQNDDGHYDDDFMQITVRSESMEWSAKNTICVSNTLKKSKDWSAYTKPCPKGAKKQKVMPFAHQYNGKLILIKAGDVFRQNLATYPNQSNFKVGFFGDKNEAPPEIDGDIEIGITNIVKPTNAPPAGNYLKISNAKIKKYGWPENVYFEGLKIKNFAFPMSYKHVGIHDIDMDRSAYATGGNINVVNGSDICYSGKIDCKLVPFSKGGYISSVKIVGFSGGNGGPGVNIVQTACAMVNYLGITDISVRRTREHNLRIAGWYRLNIMRSLFQGQHELPGKSKITLRACLRSGGKWEGGIWDGHQALASAWNDDVEGRTRADSAATDGTIEFAHSSRYQVVAYNQLGDPEAQLGAKPGGLFYSSNTVEGDEWLKQDVILSHNFFATDPGQEKSASVLQVYWGTCIGNTYSGSNRCSPFVLPEKMNYRNEPRTVVMPSAPGS